MSNCPHCEEPVLPGEETREIPELGSSGPPAKWHSDCALRAVIGGLNHLQGKCTCCGGTQPPDPPELTTRQAAKAAVDFYYTRLSRLGRGKQL